MNSFNILTQVYSRRDRRLRDNKKMSDVTAAGDGRFPMWRLTQIGRKSNRGARRSREEARRGVTSRAIYRVSRARGKVGSDGDSESTLRALAYIEEAREARSQWPFYIDALRRPECRLSWVKSRPAVSREIPSLRFTSFRFSLASRPSDGAEPRASLSERAEVGSLRNHEEGAQGGPPGYTLATLESDCRLLRVESQVFIE